MKKIVPGGYYSYDAAGKKIWLDYSYYGVGLENIDRIRNLSKNLDLYSSSGAGKPITVENGCITHSYQGTEADTDKIQVTLRTPITNSLTELTPVDGVVTLSTDGKVLVLPTENGAVLPCFNEYVLNPNRLTVAESPFGGLKGSGSPDYAVGTLYTPTDGIYLTDIAGNNSTKTLTAGKLTELGLLTVDTDAHTITEEFIIQNDGSGTDVLVIDACDSVDGWSLFGATGTITVENGRLKITGVSTSSVCYIEKNISSDLSSKYFLAVDFQSNVGGNFYLSIGSDVDNRVYWGPAKTTTNHQADTTSKYIMPFKAPVSISASNPETVVGSPAWNSEGLVRVGQYVGTIGTEFVSYIDNITACNGTWAKVEVAVPDKLLKNPNNTSKMYISGYNPGVGYASPASLRYDGSNYTWYGNLTWYSDGTKLCDIVSHVWAAPAAVYNQGNKGDIVGKASFTNAGITAPTSVTYSSTAGTSKRIGFAILMPPSDGERTDINKVRLKLVTYYDADPSGNMGATTYELSNDNNASTGLQNLSKPWIALYDPANSLIDFYLFTHRPQNLSFKRDETGTIYSLSLYPGAGAVYHGQIPFADLTLDTNSDSVPDCLEAAVNGSVTKFLANYSMVI